jgi:hypothetical protein
MKVEVAEPPPLLKVAVKVAGGLLFGLTLLNASLPRMVMLRD